MKVKERTGWRGWVRIIVRDLDGRVIEDVTLRNQIKNVGLNLVRDGLSGAVSSSEIKYLAWGKSDTANNPGQTTLVDEFGRKAVTSQEAGSTGVLNTTTYISPQEGNDYAIKELGWFAGSGATIAKDSGVLVARVLYSHTKTALESIQTIRTDTLSEVV